MLVAVHHHLMHQPRGQLVAKAFKSVATNSTLLAILDTLATLSRPLVAQINPLHESNLLVVIDVTALIMLMLMMM